VDANIIGIFFWDVQDRIVEANDAFLSMVGLDRKNLVSSGVRWMDLTPTDWYEHQPQLKGAGQPTTVRNGALPGGWQPCARVDWCGDLRAR
jgi:PAS fold.